MKKLELRDKVASAYLRATGGSDGWAVFVEMVQAKRSQEEIARKFGVSLSTSQRWHSEYHNLGLVQQ